MNEPGGAEYVVAVVAPHSEHAEYLVHRGVGESLWLLGDHADAVRFLTAEEAEKAAEGVRRARVGGTFLVVPCPSGDRYLVGVYTPATGRVVGLDDDGELTSYLESSTSDSELGASEFASLIRDLRLSDLYRVEVRPYEPAPSPLIHATRFPWWRRILLRLGL